MVVHSCLWEAEDNHKSKTSAGPSVITLICIKCGEYDCYSSNNKQTNNFKNI